MLVNSAHLQGLVIQATDGDVGEIKDFYFDDETWAIRYFVVETGGWLDGRQVLISPFSIDHVDWVAKRLQVDLTKKQVEKSPGVDTQQPVSRQYEAEYLGYYGYPYYWGGPNLWGAAFFPVGAEISTTASMEVVADQARKLSTDTHLRSAKDSADYSIAASDGEFGHLAGFVFGDRAWAIRYIEVATRNWLPGKKVLMSPDWIEKVSWPDSAVYVGLTKEKIQSAPDYDESLSLNREYESRIYKHYGRPPYWLREAELRSTFTPAA